MNAILATEPEKCKDATIATWKKLGKLTDAKIRQLSTKYGASTVKIDDTVIVSKWVVNEKIYQSWVKKDSPTKSHGVIRIIKPNQWVEERQEKDNKKHGYARVIWHDGRYEEEYFKEGVRHGPETAHRKNGELKYTQHYREGKKVDSPGPQRNQPNRGGVTTISRPLGG